MRHSVGLIAIGLVAGLAPALPGLARASDAASIVVPGRPGVPVIINGVDATGAAVYRDWGLSRPGVPVEIWPGPYLIAPPLPMAEGFFPATGRRPRYGRDEVDPGPNRRLPPPAEPYHRSWSSTPSGMSADVPASAPEYTPPLANGGDYGLATPQPRSAQRASAMDRHMRHSTRLPPSRHGPRSGRGGRSHSHHR
jgi:hypothetical protein